MAVPQHTRRQVVMPDNGWDDESKIHSHTALQASSFMPVGMSAHHLRGADFRPHTDEAEGSASRRLLRGGFSVLPAEPKTGDSSHATQLLRCACKHEGIRRPEEAGPERPLGTA